MSGRITSVAARAGAATVVAALGLTVLAGPANAESFSRRVYQGTVSYNDGQDSFCVHADETNIHDRAVIDVTLTPDDASRGPVKHLGDIDTPGQECASLATAYEDTHYTAVVKSTKSFDRVTGKTTYETTKISFYS